MTVRAEFIANGRLLNTQDTSFREINSDWPILALSRDLGNITRASDPVVFSVGHIRDPVIQYVVSSGVQERFLYFWSRFSSADDVVSFVDVFQSLSTSDLSDFCRSTPFWVISKMPFFGLKILTTSFKVMQARYHQTMHPSLPYPLHRLSVLWKSLCQ